MEPRNVAPHYWLEGPEGRVLIRRASLLVGRSPDCDVVLPEAQVSRHHALFRLDEQGVEVVQLGRVPLTVNDGAASPVTRLRDGDVVAICGRRFRLVVTAAPPNPERELAWVITRSGAMQHPVSRDTFTVGGGEGDDLFVESWPANALTFTRLARALVLQANVPDVVCDEALDVGALVGLKPGARITLGSVSLRVLALARDATPATAPMLAAELPVRARLEFLPRGGRLTLSFGAREHSAWLADRRCDLVATLLKPPTPWRAGEAIADEVIHPRVWPGGESGRTELNTLVFRARKDLVKADLDGTALIERSPGAVRFRLAEGASVEVGDA